jgi:hypothetical protein
VEHDEECETPAAPHVKSETTSSSKEALFPEHEPDEERSFSTPATGHAEKSEPPLPSLESDAASSRSVGVQVAAWQRFQHEGRAWWYKDEEIWFFEDEQENGWECWADPQTAATWWWQSDQMWFYTATGTAEPPTKEV